MCCKEGEISGLEAARTRRGMTVAVRAVVRCILTKERRRERSTKQTGGDIMAVHLVLKVCRCRAKLHVKILRCMASAVTLKASSSGMVANPTKGSSNQ